MIGLITQLWFRRRHRSPHPAAQDRPGRPIAAQPPTDTGQQPFAPLRPSESFCWVCGRPEVSFCPEKCLTPLSIASATPFWSAAAVLPLDAAAVLPLDAAEEAADARAAAALDAEVAV